MPKVDRVDARQTARPATLPLRKAGGVLAEAVAARDLPDDWISLLIYGGNRVGKTTLACCFDKPLLLVSCEPARTGGARSVKRVEGVSLLRVTAKGGVLLDGRKQAETTSARWDRLLEELSAPQRCPFATVVLDGATSFQDLILQELMGWDVMPEQLNFGAVSGDVYRERAEKVKEKLRPFLALNCNRIVLAKEKDHNPPREERVNERTGKVQPDMRPKFLRGLQQESFVSADVGGATAGWLNDACDFVTRLYVVAETVEKVHKVKVLGKEQERREETLTGRYVRRLLTSYHPNYAAGIRSEVGLEPGKVPDYVEAASPAEMYRKFMRIVKGE